MEGEADQPKPEETLQKRGWVRIPPKLNRGALRAEYPDTVVRGGYAYRSDFWDQVIVALGANGCDLGEFSRDFQISRAALKPVLSFLEESGRGRTLKDRFSCAEDLRLPGLSPFDKATLDLLQRAGPEGLDTKRIKIRGLLPSLERLAEKGLARGLTDTLFWDAEVCRRMGIRLMEGSLPGGRISIAQARKRTGLSRRFLLPLFGFLEAEGYLKREGNLRIVVGPSTRANA